MKVRYHAEARVELGAAVEWYDKRRTGLGWAFNGEVEQAEEQLVAHPLRGPRWPGVREDVHRYVLARFPYSLAYLIQGETLVILAVAHQRRRPFYWRGRLASATAPESGE